jgi:hypothetical protein
MMNPRARDDVMRVINNGFSLLEHAAALDASGAALVLLERFRELLQLCAKFLSDKSPRTPPRAMRLAKYRALYSQ